MDIRAMTLADLAELVEIDGTIESECYLHVERAGEGLAMSWSLHERPRREKLIEANRPGDELVFVMKQLAGGIEEGVAMVAEHEGRPVALLLARVRPERNTLELLDVRVDYDVRRQGLGTVLVCEAIKAAKEMALRAVMARTLASNAPAGRFLAKAGFDLAGLDAQFLSNHDLVKENVSLFWYLALD